MRKPESELEQKTSLGGIWFRNDHDNLRGAQLGFVNMSNENSYGVQAGYSNFTLGKFTGLQIGVMNLTNYMSGLQFGVSNGAVGPITGAQIGVIGNALNASSSIGEEPSKGAVQIGLIYNVAFNKPRGLQAGLVNFIYNEPRSFEMKDNTLVIQLGLLNIRKGVPWYATVIPFVAVRKKSDFSLRKAYRT